MKFTCSQTALSKVISTVSKAISKRTTIPALEGILLQAGNDNSLMMTSSDMDFSIETKIQADVEEEGQIIVMARLFQEIVRKLPSEDITISCQDDEKVTVNTTNSRFDIIGLSADEFPSIGRLENIEAELSFNRQLLRSMIARTQFCVSNDESRGIITGILMELEENEMHMASLDGFRMAVAREEMHSEKPLSIVIHGRIMNEISKILGESDDEDETVRLLLGDKKAALIMGETTMIMRLMEGKFIQYKDILKNADTTEVIVDRRALSDAVERASLLAKEGKNNLVILQIADDQMIILSTSEKGKVKEEINIDMKGKDLEIGFNSKYLLDVLHAIDDDEVMLRMETPTSSCIVRPLEGDTYEYLILPVRIPSN